jgi:hypothetical protein
MADDPKDDPKYSLIVVPPLLPGQDPKDPLKYYKLTYRDYTKTELLPAEAGTIRQMIKYGAAFGYLPSGLGVGIGSMCYLANLRSLRTPDDRIGIPDDKK